MRGTSPVVGKPMGGRMAGAWCMVHGMSRAPGTEGEGVCGGKTQGGLSGGSPPVAQDEDRNTYLWEV